MKKKPVRAKTKAQSRVTIGLQGFARISAVEGLHLTDEMLADFKEFDRQGLAPAERRKAIARKYGVPFPPDRIGRNL